MGSHTVIDGFHLAKNLVEHLKLNLGKLKLVEGDNFDNLALWHGRITGCFAEAGVKQNFLIEVSREFRRKWHTDFLTRYRRTKRGIKGKISAYDILQDFNLNVCMAL